MVAICLASQTKVLMDHYDRSNWQAHFDTEADCHARLDTLVRVHMLTPYATMSRLLREAVDVLLAHSLHAAQGLTVANFSASTIDSSQGGTWDATVLALPVYLADWSNFLCEAKR